MSKDDKLVKRTEGQETEQVPDFLKLQQGQPAAGTENIGSQDVILPRLGLCQSGSPQRKKSDPKYIDGLEEGIFFNTVTKVIYGSKVRVLPVLFYKQRIRFTPMEEGGGILCQSPDSLHGIGDPGGLCIKCPKAQFQKNEPPECDEFYNFASIIVINNRIVPENLAVVSMKSTAIPVAKGWNSRIRLTQRDIFASMYDITSAEVKKDSQSWHTYVIDGAGFVPNKEMYDVARMCYEAMSATLKEGRLKFDAEDLGPGGGENTKTAEM